VGPIGPYDIGQTAHQPLTYRNGEESIGKLNPMKASVKMYRRKETLQQAPLNKRKYYRAPRCANETGMATVADCAMDNRLPGEVLGQAFHGWRANGSGPRWTLVTTKEMLQYQGIP